MIFEIKYGKESASIYAIDLLYLQDKPEARQLYFKIFNYVKSDYFAPDTKLDKDILTKILP